MARGRSIEKNTSITEAAAATFITDNPERATMFCKDLPGFYLIKLKHGGAWRYRYQSITGARRTATIGKYPQMLPNAAAKIARGWRDDYTDPLKDAEHRQATKLSEHAAAELRTLGSYIDGGYAAHMATWEEYLSRSNTGRLKGHFAHLLSRDMATLCKADIDAWAISHRGKLAHTTLRRNWASLRALLNTAVADGLLEANPLAGYKSLPSATAEERSREADDPGRQKRRALTDAEITAILEGLDSFADEIRAERRSSRAHGKEYLTDLDNVRYPHWFIPFCLLALHTGLAPSDLRSMTWEHLNVTFGQIRKARHKTVHLLRKPNGRPAQMTIRLNDDIQEVMRAWQSDCMQVTGITESPTNLVFPPKRPGATQRDAKSHMRHWARVKALAGLDDDLLDFYSLRHNFISRLVMAGVPLLTVAQLVGHKSATMIERHYAHLCPEQAGRAMNIIADQIRQSSVAVVSA